MWGAVRQTGFLAMEADLLLDSQSECVRSIYSESWFI